MSKRRHHHESRQEPGQEQGKLQERFSGMSLPDLQSQCEKYQQRLVTSGGSTATFSFLSALIDQRKKETTAATESGVSDNPAKVDSTPESAQDPVDFSKTRITNILKEWTWDKAFDEKEGPVEMAHVLWEALQSTLSGLNALSPEQQVEDLLFLEQLLETHPWPIPQHLQLQVGMFVLRTILEEAFYNGYISATIMDVLKSRQPALSTDMELRLLMNMVSVLSCRKMAEHITGILQDKIHPTVLQYLEESDEKQGASIKSFQGRFTIYWQTATGLVCLTRMSNSEVRAGFLSSSSLASLVKAYPEKCSSMEMTINADESGGVTEKCMGQWSTVPIHPNARQDEMQAGKLAKLLWASCIRELQVASPDFLPWNINGKPIYVDNNELRTPFVIIDLPETASLNSLGKATADRVLGAVNLPKNWRVRQLASLFEVEQALCTNQDLLGQFTSEDFRSDNAGNTSSSSAGEKGSSGRRDRIPRTSTLRRVLLEERIPWTLSWDEGGHDVSQTSNPGQVAEHHWTIWTTDRGVRFFVSDDPGRALIVVRNTNIPAEEFIGKVDVKSLIDHHGGTEVLHRNSEAFAEGIRNAIPAKGQPVKVIYPISHTFDNPLNRGDFEFLRPDIEEVARRAGKTDCPWKLTVADFHEIRSSEDGLDWAFGGHACGQAFLQRVGRKLGHDPVAAHPIARGTPPAVKVSIEAVRKRLRALYESQTLAIVLEKLYPDQPKDTGDHSVAAETPLDSSK